MTIPEPELFAYAPLEPMLSKIPSRATPVSDASQVSKLPVARGANCGAANTVEPKVSAQSAVQMRGAMMKNQLSLFLSGVQTRVFAWFLCIATLLCARFSWISNVNIKLQGP
jgi:hypothetical protein